jgi:hypothetical protein
LDAFQELKLSANAEAEKFVLNIIEKTSKADELSELKSLTDAKGDFNNMHKLASVQAAHNALGSSHTQRRRGRRAWRKILSDVDDTLLCSYGPTIAGIDQSYPKKVLYPGVLAFYRELDLGTAGEEVWDSKTNSGNLVFLSARPHIYQGHFYIYIYILSHRHSYIHTYIHTLTYICH